MYRNTIIFRRTVNFVPVGTPTCHHIYFLYSVLHFASQLSFLCLHTHPCNDPDNSRLTVTVYSVLCFSSQQAPLSLISDSRTESGRNYFSITHQSNSLSERVVLMCNGELVRKSEISERGSCCKEKRRTEYAVTIKWLLTRPVHGWVCRQRKESCESKRRTE
jgi:hypothetical protein